MANLQKQKDYWKPCRPGTILSVSDTKFQRERRRLIIRGLMACVVAGTGIFSSLFVLSQRQNRRSKPERSIAGSSKDDHTIQSSDNSITPVVFTCDQIETYFDDYLIAVRTKCCQRTVRQQELVDSFDQHIKICQPCRELVLVALRDF